jgi:hypothetical protein
MLSLNVWPQRFVRFPNISERFEWFAIEHTGKYWIKNPVSIGLVFCPMTEPSYSSTKNS